MEEDIKNKETPTDKPETCDEEGSALYPCCIGGGGAALRFFYEEYTKSQEKSNKDQTENGKNEQSPKE